MGSFAALVYDLGKSTEEKGRSDRKQSADIENEKIPMLTEGSDPEDREKV